MIPRLREGVAGFEDGFVRGSSFGSSAAKRFDVHWNFIGFYFSKIEIIRIWQTLNASEPGQRQGWPNQHGDTTVRRTSAPLEGCDLALLPGDSPLEQLDLHIVHGVPPSPVVIGGAIMCSATEWSKR